MTPAKSEALAEEHDTAVTAEHEGFIVPGPKTELLLCKSTRVASPGYRVTQHEGSRGNAESTADKRCLSPLFSPRRCFPHN